MSELPFDPPMPPPTPRPTPTPVGQADDRGLLAQLIRLVTQRARQVGVPTSGDRPPMEDLREAVDALGHYLDAAQLVRTATEVPSLAPEAWSSPPEQARFQAEVERPGVDDPGFRRFRDRATGLYTRAGFEAIAEGELKRCVRHSREFSLLLIRLSKAAEADVRGAAGAVRNGLRASDPVGYSGSRLLLIGLPETSEEESRAISRRLVKALETRGVWGDGAHTGLASRTNDGESLSGLIEAARKGG